MRAEDLIPAFCDALDALGRHDCASMARSAYEGAPCDADNLGYILDFLFNALDACAPRAYYFGAHPGDGSDYGFWQIEEDWTMALSREEWLGRALHDCIAPYLAQHGADVPPDCRVSVGFPGGGSARKRIGECWPRSRSSIGVNEIFINPALREQFSAVEVLVHEAIHASDDCASGHKGHFARVAKACGLEGKMTATHAGDALRVVIESWIAALPPIEHGALSLDGRKKQTTRLLKAECNACGCAVRITQKWLDNVGAPYCGCGAGRMDCV
jgi:hypothetical protein